MKQWIESECNHSNFGDKRLKNRYAKKLEEMSSSPSESIPASCGGWSETIGAYRFLNNDGVNYTKILEGHQHGSFERIKEVETILAIQDTSSVDETGHRSSGNLGHIENGFHRGFFVHPTIAVTPDKINLGNISVEMWTRDIATKGKKKDRKQKDITEKESYRWINSYRSANSLAERFPEKTIISIGDRESDIYELFEEATLESSKAKLIVRAAQDRKLINEEDGISLLWKELESTEELGVKELMVTQTQHHKSRETELSIRVKEILLKAPYRKGKKLKDIKLKAVLAVEKNPPSEEDKIEWLLITTLDVNKLEEAHDVIDYYSCRWQIELFFRILKGGCKIEKLQLEELSALENATAVYMVISWRIQYLLMLGRQCPNLPADILFSYEELKSIFVAKSKPYPEKPPTLNEMIIMISTLGGYLNRKKEKPQGVKVFWIGLAKLTDYAFMYGKMIELERCV